MFKPTLPRHLLVAMALTLCGMSTSTAEDLRGHGGPVGALAVSDDGTQILSGSFDTRSILWVVETASAIRVMRVHEGNVTAVAFLPEGRLATGGQDGRLAIWPQSEATSPERVEAVHDAPVAALALHPDGTVLASGGWDGRIGITMLDGGDIVKTDAHQGPVHGLGFLEDGRLVSVGTDLRLRVWSLGSGLSLANTVDIPSPPSALAVTHSGLVAVTSADGALRLVDPDDGTVSEVALSDRPLITVDAAGASSLLATASVEGQVWLLDPEGLEVRQTLRPGQGPVWAVALDASGETLFTAGGDGLIRRWNALTGEAVGSGDADPQMEVHADGSRGAEVWRACAVCHTLTPDDGHRAGPTLHGIFGRRIATADSYDYSEALREMDIVWTPRTVSELFEFGPDAYTPGSRMPEQRVSSAEDRAALMEFLERHAMQ